MLIRVVMTLLLLGAGAVIWLVSPRSARVAEQFEQRLRGHSDWPNEWMAKLAAVTCFVLALLVAVGVLGVG